MYDTETSSARHTTEHVARVAITGMCSWSELQPGALHRWRFGSELRAARAEKLSYVANVSGVAGALMVL